MTKQRNYVAKNDFNKGGAHKDKSKTLPRDEKYPSTIEVDEEDIKAFVEDLYKDGKTPCERFGMTWEMLGEIEDEMSKDKLYYKGFEGSINWSEEDSCWYGKILNTEHLITYEGDFYIDLVEAFKSTIDEELLYNGLHKVVEETMEEINNSKEVEFVGIGDEDD